MTLATTLLTFQITFNLQHSLLENLDIKGPHVPIVGKILDEPFLSKKSIFTYQNSCLI